MSRLFVAMMIGALASTGTVADAQSSFRVGFAKRDITPQTPLPMWGYAARHALPGTSVRDPLLAKVLVIEAGSDRLALIGLDLGQCPHICHDGTD